MKGRYRMRIHMLMHGCTSVSSGMCQVVVWLGAQLGDLCGWHPTFHCSVSAREGRWRREDEVSRDGGGKENEWKQVNHTRKQRCLGNSYP
jgi:hypothetical protein